MNRISAPVFAFIRRSTQRKFLLIMFAALIAVNGPLLVTFFLVTKNALEREMIARKHVLVDANSEALSKLLWDFDHENLEKWTATIANEPDIFSIEILDDKNKRLVFLTDGQIDENRAGTAEQLYSKAIIHTVDDTDHKVGTLQIQFTPDSISSAAILQVGYSVILFVASTISVLFAAIFANRFMIARPLDRLNNAIENTHRTGIRSKVDWSSQDELGRVSDAFNEMQDSLDQDEIKLRKANKRLGFLYNNTPVLLYSIDSDDRIVNVSDYWLSATGYDREAVIGRAFSDLIHPDFREEYLTNRGQLPTQGQETQEFTSVFEKADGSQLDVLITIAKDFDASSTGRRALSVMTDISKLKAAEAEILRQSRTDFLTGLLNREGFLEKLTGAIHSAGADDDIAVLFFDLDRFKWVNDNLGHFAGDQILQSVTHRITELLDGQGCFGRFGGDEFAIMLSGTRVKPRAIELAAAINQALKTPIEFSGRTLQITASVGISFYPENANTAEDEIGGAKFDHGSVRIVLLRAA